jgi:hypothetical protein
MRRHRLLALLAGVLVPTVAIMGAGMTPLGMATAAAQAEAAPGCGRAGRPWVSVAYSGEAWDPKLRASVTADLRAGLDLQGIDACPLGTQGGERPLALIEMRASEDNRVAVSIDVHDAVTEKRVLRDVDLHKVPSDGHGLTLAVAAEELLRASWAELALIDHPAPAREPPPEVRQVVERSLGGRARFLLGARAAFEQSAQGLSWLGGDALFAHWPLDRLGYELALQVRHGLPERSVRGEVESNALGGAAALLFAPSGRSRATAWQVRLGLSALSVGFDGVADGSAEAVQARGLDLHAQLGVGLRQRLVRGLDLSLDAGVGAPLRSVAALDGDTRVTGTGGVQFTTSLGVEARF